MTCKRSGKKGGEIPVSFDTVSVARAAAQAGQEALAGKPGPTREGLVLAAALCLWHVGRYDSVSAAADAVREVLTSGRALAHMRHSA